MKKAFIILQSVILLTGILSATQRFIFGNMFQGPFTLEASATKPTCEESESCAKRNARLDARTHCKTFDLKAKPVNQAIAVLVLCQPTPQGQFFTKVKIHYDCLIPCP